MTTTLHLELRPYREPMYGHAHTARFESWLGDQLICIGKSGWHEPARKLLAMGYPPDTLLHVQHAGRPHDPTIVPQAIGELAKWTIVDGDAAGRLHKRPWTPFAWQRQ